MSCEICKSAKVVLIRPSNKKKLCKSCFLEVFEKEVHKTIIENNLFTKNEKIAVAISGGKDSTVLAYILNLLNKKYNYGVELFLLCVDEGITNYRDHSIETVKKNQEDYHLPLKIVSYQEYFNITMDAIVQKIGRKSNCTYCGILRRQALEKGAQNLGVSQIVTGHNADDMAETILMNLLRGDFNRLYRSSLIKSISNGFNIPRSKPFKFMFEKEIVMYSFYRNLHYFSTECCYSPGAYRGHARLFIKELERKNPRIILNIINSCDDLENLDVTNRTIFKCKKCLSFTSLKSNICKACELLNTINETL
ncbi:TIGR00269 family protein [Edhazardia aedis USNM 41457]|uniref:Cytoplasmic tRNA 2-thiolation protein 1 n=1 Tax=Edhazardia aedis (strain USNM 41457) TaxID=1003232 RepID=J9DBR2_EDHAE|nr:TIGR00269 family protein [Edhazardia aedis USNM 41457]|eukprot:EJW04929.1 TIGR00269 family protein [Edhazardia aedis USNM 41457]